MKQKKWTSVMQILLLKITLAEEPRIYCNHII